MGSVALPAACPDGSRGKRRHAILYKVLIDFEMVGSSAPRI